MNTKTDLVTISEREVVEISKVLARRMNDTRFMFNAVESEFLRAVSLLESREQIRKQLEAKNEGK